MKMMGTSFFMKVFIMLIFPGIAKGLFGIENCFSSCTFNYKMVLMFSRCFVICFHRTTDIKFLIVQWGILFHS